MRVSAHGISFITIVFIILLYTFVVGFRPIKCRILGGYRTFCPPKKHFVPTCSIFDLTNSQDDLTNSQDDLTNGQDDLTNGQDDLT